MAESIDYYRILQVSPQATPSEIKRAFRRLARQVHPDLNPHDLKAAAQFKQLSEAYELLSNPERRSHYDTLHGDPTAEPSTSSSPQGISFQRLYGQGLDKLAQRDYSGAIANFSEALSIFPAGIEAYLGRCKAYDALQDDRAVLEDCYQILQRNPNAAQAYLYQGQARARLGYPQGAIEAYTKAIALEARFSQAYYRRAQARLQIQEEALARQDLQSAIALHRAQQEWSQAQQAERLLNRLQPPTAHANSKVSQPFVQHFWKIALSSLPSVVFNPSDNLLPVFARLTPYPAAWTGLFYGLIAVGGGILSGMIDPASAASWPQLGLMGVAVYFSLALGSAIARSLTRGQGSYPGDLFLAGVVSLPLAGMALGSRLFGVLGFGGLGWTVLGVFTGCYCTLLLYIGYTQISHIPESHAMVAVPCILLVSLGSVVMVSTHL